MRLLLGKSGFFWARLGLLLLVFSFWTTAADAQATPPSPVPLPVPFTPIVDNAQVIDSETRQRLESIYLNLKDRGNIEYAVLTVNTTDGRDIFDFSLAVARGWGIGPKDGDKAGLLLVVAIQDRKYFTQVSRHLEGDLPDGLVGQIQRERLIPAFRQGNYSKGILDTIQSYAATLAAKRGFSIQGIDQRYVYRGTPRNTPQTAGQGFAYLCIGLLVLMVLIVLLSSAGRRRGGGGGCLHALLWGSLFSNLGGRDSSGWGSTSGWTGGGFGGGDFGGGGGFGGGFGGGGDFGGGGSGGSW